MVPNMFEPLKFDCDGFQGGSSGAVLICLYVSYCNCLFHCLSLISSSLDASGKLCFIGVAFLGNFIYILARKRNAGYIVYATINKYTRYWRANQCCTTQIGILSKGCIFFLIISQKIEWNFVNLFNKDERLYKNEKSECNVTFNTFKLSVNLTRSFFFRLRIFL